MDLAYLERIWSRLEAKVDRMIGPLDGKTPHVAGENGKYDDTAVEWWTSGFWPGMLWVMYDMTGKAHYKEAAWSRDLRLEERFARQAQSFHHDVGFQFLSTAVIKHKITGDQDGLRRGIDAANYLASRFNLAGSFLRAWNGDRAGWSIIDSMMNLSLLFWASESTGDPRYKHIAVRHAETTMAYGVREDGSTNHILSFDPESGECIESFGGQGLAPDSAWSRGNAWALYGFANAYRYTGDIRFLNVAKRVAHYFVASLPDDHVPYWDFRLESLDGMSRDSSAAAIAASGLLEIAEAVPAGERRTYRRAAERIMKSLTDNYATWHLPDHEAILLHATGSGTVNIDVSLIYGDYFYIEAFAKLRGWKRRIY